MLSRPPGSPAALFIFCIRGKTTMIRKLLAAGMLAGLMVAGAAVLGSAPASKTEEGKNSAKKEPWKPADFIYSEAAGQYRISPDGKWLVWVKSVGDKDKDARVSNLAL